MQVRGRDAPRHACAAGIPVCTISVANPAGRNNSAACSTQCGVPAMRAQSLIVREHDGGIGRKRMRKAWPEATLCKEGSVVGWLREAFAGASAPIKCVADLDGHNPKADDFDDRR